jgi:transcriptional/translational regulatory protein YebC/TACO1
LAAADAGAEDIRSEEETVVIICAPEAVEAVQQALSAAGFPVSSAEAVLVPLNTVEVSDRDVAKKLLKLMDALDDLEDVQNVTANFDISDELAEELAAAPPLH